MEYLYQVAFSYAEEDKAYVNKVAERLKEKNVKLFMYESEMVEMWGQDLYFYFNKIIEKKARYFIPFISENYKKKKWTNYELKVALVNAILNKDMYVLPARFDDAEIEWISYSISYIDLRKYTPEEFADIIIMKIMII